MMTDPGLTDACMTDTDNELDHISPRVSVRVANQTTTKYDRSKVTANCLSSPRTGTTNETTKTSARNVRVQPTKVPNQFRNKH